MLEKIMEKLGLARSRSAGEYTDRYASLSPSEQEEVIEAYLSEDLASHPPKHLAQTALRLWKEGKAKEADQHYSAAISMTPSDSTLLLNRGNLYFELGRYEEAIADFEAAKKGTPLLPDHLLVNYNMIQMLGIDSPVLQGLAQKNKAKFHG